MNEDLLPQHDPPEIEPPERVYCFWEIAMPLGILIIVIAAIIIRLRMNQKRQRLQYFGRNCV